MRGFESNNSNNTVAVGSLGSIVNFFRIHTENVSNFLPTLRLIESRFDSFNLVFGRGSYLGKAEDSVTIELLGANELDVRMLAQEIKELNHQKEVLITVTPVNEARI